MASFAFSYLASCSHVFLNRLKLLDMDLVHDSCKKIIFRNLLNLVFLALIMLNFSCINHFS